jgi:hypothetical protein
MRSQPPVGSYLPKLALLGGKKLTNAKLTLGPAGAVLEGDCRESLGVQPVAGYECVVEAVGWRWRFRGVANAPDAVQIRAGGVVPISVMAVGPIAVESALGGQEAYCSSVVVQQWAVTGASFEVLALLLLAALAVLVGLYPRRGS